MMTISSLMPTRDAKSKVDLRHKTSSAGKPQAQTANRQGVGSRLSSFPSSTLLLFLVVGLLIITIR